MMTPLPLKYGTRRRVSPCLLFKRILVVVGFLLLYAWGIRTASQRLYYLDRDGVHSAFAGIPGGRVVQIEGFDNGVGWTVASAEVSTDGSGARTIAFRSPRRHELESGSRMCVMGIGGYRLDVEVDDERVLIQHLDLGHEGEFREVLPFRARNVRELAARYDEILAFVSQQPCGTYTARDGKIRTYRIRARK